MLLEETREVGEGRIILVMFILFKLGSKKPWVQREKFKGVSNDILVPVLMPKIASSDFPHVRLEKPVSL